MPNVVDQDPVYDFGAKIVTFEEINVLRPHLGRIVATSGGFDPIHPEHISCILDSKKYGDTLVVIVNGDNFLTNKRGRPFLDLATRCLIVSALRDVDYVIPFEIDNDPTVSVALEQLRPHVFTKGGDRVDAATIPEWPTCEQNQIEIISGVGLDKKWSSSEFLRQWEQGQKQ